MTGWVAGDTALRWYVYLLVLAFSVWGVLVLVLIAGGVGCRARRVMSAPTSDDTGPFTRAQRMVEDLLEREPQR